MHRAQRAPCTAASVATLARRQAPTWIADARKAEPQLECLYLCSFAASIPYWVAGTGQDIA